MTHAEITPTLTVTPRGEATANALRQQGLTPLELYGHSKENRHLAAPTKELTKLFKQFGETTLIDVIEDGKTTKVLFTEAQLHPLTHEILHLDLHAVNLKEKITAEVPISFVGASPAVDNLGGTLIESKQTIEVECLPTDLPHELEVNIAALATFEDTLRVADINLPANVELISDREEVIASIQEPRSEEELAALDEKIEDVDVEEAVSVDEKGKDDAESAADAE